VFYLAAGLNLKPTLTLNAAMLQPPPPDGPAQRTRAATKSPQKPAATVRAPPKALARRPLKKKKPVPPSDVRAGSPAETPPPGLTVQDTPRGQPPTSPYHVPFRSKKVIRVPSDIIAFSQPGWDEEYVYEDEEPDGDITHRSAERSRRNDDERSHPANPSPDAHAARKRFVPDEYELSSDSEAGQHGMSLSCDFVIYD